LEEIGKEIRYQEDQYKKMESELDKIDATLAAVAIGEGERDVTMSSDEKQKLMEKREVLHAKLTNKQATEDLFARKKEMFELPAERGKLQDEAHKKQLKGHAIAAERDVGTKVLAERKTLHASVLSLLEKMGAPFDEATDGIKTMGTPRSARAASRNTTPRMADAKRGIAANTTIADEKPKLKKASFFGSIKRLFKCSGGDGAATKA